MGCYLAIPGGRRVGSSGKYRFRLGKLSGRLFWCGHTLEALGGSMQGKGRKVGILRILVLVGYAVNDRYFKLHLDS